MLYDVSNYRALTHSLEGDTIGGIGSAIALKRGTFVRNANGTFSGTIVAQPDRGFNMYAGDFAITEVYI